MSDLPEWLCPRGPELEPLPTRRVERVKIEPAPIPECLQAAHAANKARYQAKLDALGLTHTEYQRRKRTEKERKRRARRAAEAARK